MVLIVVVYVACYQYQQIRNHLPKKLKQLSVKHRSIFERGFVTVLLVGCALNLLIIFLFLDDVLCFANTFVK